MKIAVPSLLAGLALAVAAPSPGHAFEEREVITYGCDEVVVIGRIRTLGYTDFSTPDDLLGYGRFDLEIRVKRIVHGAETRRVVPAFRIAHGQLREDSDFWLVLTPAAEGAYTIKSAGLTSGPYRFAAKCE